MCVQCIAGAMAAGAAATGTRAWLPPHAGRWLTAGRKRAPTGVLILAGPPRAGVSLNGTHKPPGPPARRLSSKRAGAGGAGAAALARRHGLAEEVRSAR